MTMGNHTAEPCQLINIHGLSFTAGKQLKELCSVGKVTADVLWPVKAFHSHLGRNRGLQACTHDRCMMVRKPHILLQWLWVSPSLGQVTSGS